MANTIVWADIPVADMDRARAFYGAVLQAKIALMDGSDGTVALLPWDPEVGGVGADLAKGENLKPSAEGAAVYLDCGGDIDGMLRRVVAAGGKVLLPPTDMGDMVGTISFFLDSEGNRIGLHLAPQRQQTVMRRSRATPAARRQALKRAACTAASSSSGSSLPSTTRLPSAKVSSTARRPDTLKIQVCPTVWMPTPWYQGTRTTWAVRISARSQRRRNPPRSMVSSRIRAETAMVIVRKNTMVTASRAATATVTISAPIRCPVKNASAMTSASATPRMTAGAVPCCTW